MLTHILAGVFFLISFTFVYRSFYSMRIRPSEEAAGGPAGRGVADKETVRAHAD